VSVFLFTDFGSADLYVGQVRAAILRHAPDVTIIDLLHEAPAFNIKAGAHLLAALAAQLPAGIIVVAVVDPGVGGQRQPVALHADQRWYVGPDNGLLSVIAVRADEAQAFPIVWRPATLSASFHGRDLFAPVAGMIAQGQHQQQMNVLGTVQELEVQFGGGDLAEIIYIDHYGNAMTGLRSGALPSTGRLTVNGQRFNYARVFSEVGKGTVFWYENSIGLIEIAANQANAAQQLELEIGDSVSVEA
jgi:S-adenosylmethionine hydrolase